MPHAHRLFLPLALAALLTTGTAHAESRRAAQSLPAPVRFTLPSPAKAGREEPSRGPSTRGSDRNDNARRGGDGGRSDNRRDEDNRGGFEREKEREGHRFGHHDHHDSPGG